MKRLSVHNAVEESTLFIMGGIFYCIVELCWRGRTNSSMFIVGGICFILLGMVNHKFLKWDTPLLLDGILASILITCVEFISGMILNVWLKLNVWDYSDLPFNLFGQICLQYSVAWYVLGTVGIVVSDYLKYWLFDEQKPKYIII